MSLKKHSSATSRLFFVYKFLQWVGTNLEEWIWHSSSFAISMHPQIFQTSTVRFFQSRFAVFLRLVPSTYLNVFSNPVPLEIVTEKKSKPFVRLQTKPIPKKERKTINRLRKHNGGTNKHSYYFWLRRSRVIITCIHNNLWNIRHRSHSSGDLSILPAKPSKNHLC